jgi:branched-subunit amino acid transport protein
MSAASWLWLGVILAAGASFLQKWLGFQVPSTVLEKPVVARVTTLLPLALLGALVATQTVTSGPMVMIDARLPALAVAAFLLWRRAPVLVVVIAGAAVAAVLRALGWG